MNEIEALGKEDYFVLAKVFGDGLEEDDIPCKIYLPERPTEVPRVFLKPTQEQWERISHTFELGLSATMGDRDTERFVQIDATKMYSLESKSRHWGKQLSDPHIVCEALDLTIATAFPRESEGEGVHMVFQVTPNSLLTPSSIVTSSYTGKVDVEVIHEIVVPRPEGQFKFETHYRTVKCAKDEDRFIRNLAAVTDSPRHCSSHTKTVVAEALQELNDLLLVASLGARRQTVCISWEAVDDKFIYKSFRHGEVATPQSEDRDRDDGLILPSDFVDYLRTGFERLRGSGKESPLHLAVYCLVPLRRKTLEDDFVALFGALEKLLLAFRAKNEMEFVLDATTWKSVRSALKQTIKTWNAQSLQEQKRVWLYENLSGLNRVPLGSAFKTYMQELGVAVDDLWPVFSNDDGISLYKIRNHLTHREPLGGTSIRGLAIARQHLAWILERICLQTLGWSIAKSRISPTALRRGGYTAVGDWPEARKGLTEVLLRG